MMFVCFFSLSFSGFISRDKIILCFILRVSPVGRYVRHKCVCVRVVMVRSITQRRVVDPAQAHTYRGMRKMADVFQYLNYCEIVKT